MKNLVAKLVEVGKIELFDEDIRALHDDEILVAIKSSGICGSDMHYFEHGGLGTFKAPLPMYMGHEPSGTIVDANKSEFLGGERVAIEPGRPCVSSIWYKKGYHNLCEKGTFMGATAQGSFAQFAIVSKDQVLTIPDRMSYDMGALLEPLGVALHAMNTLRPSILDTFVIFGAGSIGLSVYFVCKKMGIAKIVLVDTNQDRVEFARSVGAEAINYKDDFKSRIKKITKGKGMTCVIDAAGNNESIDGCIHTASTRSKMGIIGIPTSDFLEYNPHKIRTKEMRIFNIRRSNQTLEDCISLFSEDFEPENIVTHRFSLDRIQEAFRLVSEKKDKVIKCMINP